MRKFVMRPRAAADLEGIWLYTFETWGEEQADRYLRQLHRAIQLLGPEPDRGRSRKQIKPGYFSIHIGRHVAFYVFTDEIVGIVRVLHDQMDPSRHF